MQSGASFSELWSGGLQYLGRRPLVILTLFYLLGIIWADWAQPPLPALAGLLALAVAVASLSLLRNLPATNLFLVLGMFLLGATLHTARLTAGAADLPPAHADELPQAEATVAEITAQSPYRQLVLLSEVTAGGVRLVRQAQVALPPEPPVRLADRVTLAGLSLWRPRPAGTPGEFDGARALARQGIHAQGRATQIVRVTRPPSVARTLSDALVRVRQAMLERLIAAMPGPDRETYAALLASMVYGVQAAPVPDEIVDGFRRSGTIHLLVVSGAQVSIIAMSLIFLMRGSRRVLPVWGMVVVAVGLVALAAVAGMGASVERAAAMAVVLLASFASGRRYDFPVALALSALVLCLVNTATLFSLGAQLTYACCLGVYLAAPHSAAEHRPRQPWAFLSFVAWSTVGAWLCATPLVVSTFRTLTLTAGLANLVDVPLSVLLLYLGLAAILLGMISTPLAAPACWAAQVLLRWILATNACCGRLPLAGLENVTFSPVQLLLWYGAVLGFFWTLRSPTPLRVARALGRRTLIAAGVCVLGIATMALVLARLPAQQLQVDVLDVGAGQCVLVRAPGGHAVLLDAGTQVMGGSEEGLARRRVLPFLGLQGVRCLDAIVLSHPHEDHCNLAAEIMQAIPTQRLLCGPQDQPEASWPVVLQTASERGVEVQSAQAGGRLLLGDQCSVTFLEPRTLLSGTADDANNNGLVEQLRYGATTVLLPADLQAEGEQRLVADYGGRLKSDVLLASHHASIHSDTPAFVRAVDPAVVIVSCGSGSRRPEPRALEVFGNRHLWRTDVSGTIHLTSDGVRLKVRGYR